ncbi:MAG TPA: TPM domain-containing protein [Steroidobacteraceae bacterium]|nr:TPM domain-containing protein [Steroidobacteraceae bacterium]
MRLARWLRHAVASEWRVRSAFPRRTREAIEQAIERVARSHRGRIRFALETALSAPGLRRRLAARGRALEIFSALRVWDTERNNGVLIYVLWAERRVEIVADRGFGGRVRTAEWQAVCSLLERHYGEGRYREGSVAGVEAAGALLTRHFPRTAADADESALP